MVIVVLVCVIVGVVAGEVRSSRNQGRSDCGLGTVGCATDRSGSE